MRSRKTGGAWLAGVAIAALLSSTAAAQEAATFEIAAGDLNEALSAYAKQSGVEIFYQSKTVAGRRTEGLQGSYTPQEGLSRLISGTGLTVAVDASGALVVREIAQGPQGGSAGGDVDALIVTAQKREENIQDVPIAISAFSQEALEAQKIEGGFDLLKAIPNVTFSKNNFTSYNFSIRGVGTKAVSATTDPGVAVSFNNTAILQNRLFEQEYFDIERVEVLRGPQGTLYGRNATSGVINVISAKPDLNDLEGMFKLEVGNYNTKRGQGMINLPLIDDVLAVRLAGAVTRRDGYDFNAVTDHPVNGRELWSTRLSVGFEPTEQFRSNFIWEHFQEDDDRLRTGKQLCHRDDGPQYIGEVEIEGSFVTPLEVRRALFGQGCKGGSLYDKDAFGTPNGLSYNFILGMLGLPSQTGVGYLPGGNQNQTIIQPRDPYGGMVQSPDLRTIASFRDPKYRAKADLFELNLEFDLTDSLTFSSQTAYVEDEVYSFQDYNRFNTVPIFTDTSVLVEFNTAIPSPYANLARDGVFCDPQLGCSSSVAGFDISKATAEQFSQELRLQSSFDGPVNFSVGANYTKFEVLADYYVMFNLMTAMAMSGLFNTPTGPVYDPQTCYASEFFFFLGAEPVSTSDPRSICPYIDPNPVESMDGEGHNYYRSKNPYELESLAGFGEVYWQFTDTVKVTAGLRYTQDNKSFTPVPTQVLLAPSIIAGGYVGKGYPADPAIEQEWGEWTGRLGVDWQPDLGFTDESLLYAFYSRGYKGGGANPPQPGFATVEDLLEHGQVTLEDLEMVEGMGVPIEQVLPVLQLTAVEYGATFDPEFVNAFEIGTKNTLLDGALTFNATAFYYDYDGYQVSQIRDRTAVNENFDAEVWGLEFETMFSPTRDLQIIGNLGYLDTKIADGETSIDIMNRTQGDPNYVLTKPWFQLPSNCVVPTPVAAEWVDNTGNLASYWEMCGGLRGILGGSGVDDPVLGGDYDPANYPELNGGAGLVADLSGNELPNAPHWTANIGAQYGFDWIDGWRATVRADAYWQSQSYHRVYNWEPYDKLHGWYNANLSLWLEHEETGVKVEVYAKNVFDETPITDAFLNSDDTGLTTNVFVLDPRLIGLSIRKEF